MFSLYIFNFLKDIIEDIIIYTYKFVYIKVMLSIFGFYVLYWNEFLEIDPMFQNSNICCPKGSSGSLALDVVVVSSCTKRPLPNIFFKDSVPTKPHQSLSKFLPHNG